jgi:GT2 family glycosyltransferase
MQEVLGKELLRLRQPLQDKNHWSSYISMEQRYGNNAVAAEISIVVPLYRRWDFVLGQLAAFSMDEIFQKGKVKIIYVIDDPSIQAEFLVWCNKHMQQESLGIEVIALRKNMGFAMACNIGIQYADTDLVCLLNSDIFPSQPGWLLPLLATHQEKQNALIAPLLMYENGLIQHAGMEVHWSDTSDGLPVCIHPHKGLDLSQLSHIQATATAYSADALSGAALFFDRKIFLDLGGFDPAFGSGDFEDLEFSLRWKRTQAELLMVPNSKLIHLEGQSICRKPDLWTSWRQGCNAWLAKELCPESKAQSL